MFRASSANLQEDIVVYMQHMVPSFSIRVPGGLSIRIILLYMFRASSAHLQEDIVVYKQHMVPSFSIRVRGDLSIRSYSCVSTGHQDSYRE